MEKSVAERGDSQCRAIDVNPLGWLTFFTFVKAYYAGDSWNNNVFWSLAFCRAMFEQDVRASLKIQFFCEQIKATLDGLMRVWPQHGRRVIDGLLVLCRNMVLN